VVLDFHPANLPADSASVLSSSSQPTDSWPGVVLEDDRESLEGLEGSVSITTSADFLQHDGDGQELTHNGFDSFDPHLYQLTSHEPAIEAVSLRDKSSSVNNAQGVLMNRSQEIVLL
jgi:hypothetical protein